MNLDEAIKHCEEVAEEQENFENFNCEYCKLGCEDGVWKDTCRYPSNIPEGWSWGECSESNCPLFSNCLECAKEHRQLAEWLRELKAYKDFEDKGYVMCRFEVAQDDRHRTTKMVLDFSTKELFDNIEEVNADERRQL